MTDGWREWRWGGGNAASVRPELVAGRADAGPQTRLAVAVEGCLPRRRSSCDKLRMNGYPFRNAAIPNPRRHSRRPCRRSCPHRHSRESGNPRPGHSPASVTHLRPLGFWIPACAGMTVGGVGVGVGWGGVNPPNPPFAKGGLFRWRRPLPPAPAGVLDSGLRRNDGGRLWRRCWRRRAGG